MVFKKLKRSHVLETFLYQIASPQFHCVKGNCIRTRKTPNTDTFHTVALTKKETPADVFLHYRSETYPESFSLKD